jgi:hypothetical protein
MDGMGEKNPPAQVRGLNVKREQKYERVKSVKVGKCEKCESVKV